MHNVDKGAIGELMVIQRLMEEGWECFTPVSHNTKVDLIAMRGPKVLRIQIKTTCETNGKAFPLYLKKTHLNKKYDYDYQADDFDYFAVVHLPTKTVVFVRSAEALDNKRVITFSLESRETFTNNKICNRRFAEEYTSLDD